MLSVLASCIILGIAYYYLSKNRILHYIKLTIAYALIWIQKKRLSPIFRFDCSSNDPERNGISAQKEAWFREAPRKLSSDIHAADCLRVCGLNKNGNFLFVSLTRRHGRCAEIRVHLRLSTGEEYQHPCHPDTLIYNTSGTKFSAGGLTFEVLEPLKRWRVIYKGYLRKKESLPSTKVSKEKMVQFNFIWHPLNNYIELPYDFNVQCLARDLASKDWLKEFFTSYSLPPEEWHIQFGQMHGLLNIEEKDELELLLRGVKARRNGVLNWKNITEKVSLEGLLYNGTNFHLFVDENAIGNKNYLYGYVCPPCNMTIKHITKFHFDANMLLFEAKNLTGEELVFESGKDIFKLSLVRGDYDFETFGGDKWRGKVCLKNVHLSLNGKSGDGIIEYCCQSETVCEFSQRKSLPHLREPDIKDCPQLVLSFMDRKCQSSATVGGKGASLALMSTLKDFSDKFIVPKGVCITKTAFSHHLQENSNLEMHIERLHSVAWTRISGSIPDECEMLTKAIAEGELLSSLKKELQQSLLETFGNIDNMRFAVRSSAIGEDGEEMSAAGQNETFLGVRGFEQICNAVLKCWASQFAFRSVEYKRQNGQLLNGGMGVVIQEMVPADIAGVLFTRDPITGSAAKMFITANYGIGESVVSATADPDTIILKRTWDDILTICSEQIGTKGVKITMADNDGTVETEIDPEEAARCTVDADLAQRLGNIAIFLERLFGSGRDIEWAVNGKQIFLLQSRPVTTENDIIDFEIMHEFDSIMRTDNERFSTANVGEVMPGAMGPLTVSVVWRSMISFIMKNMSWKVDTYRFDPTVDDSFAAFYGHAMFDRIQQKSWTLEKKKGIVTKAWELGIYGRLLHDEDICETAIERYSAAPLKNRIVLLKYGIKGALFWKTSLQTMENIVWGQPVVSANCTTAREAHEKISEILTTSNLAMKYHLEALMSSTLWNQIVISTLISGGEFTTDQYTDFAQIVGSGNGAESGDVPFSLRELALSIANEITPEVFCEMTSQQAREWLQNDKGESGKKFKKFLYRHGHRGLNEFAMECLSWSRNPQIVIDVLQGIVGDLSTYKKSPEQSIDDVLNTIKTKMSPFKKRIFPWLMKQCRQAVCGREKAKSHLIKAYDNVRREYYNLANMMVKEGLIPVGNLIFFLTHEEIGDVIKTRSPVPLRRAKHRLRLHSEMDRMKFPEMIDGLPKPIIENDPAMFEGTNQVIGYPVSKGIIKGLARVITTFHQVNTIKPGEILITFSTDIGWSPYFPMLSGVVTEIGGLISHGAVVAREFGLPCIVGAQNATLIFKTGDTVLLNATKGIITKIG